jgi:hypothetical protein
VPIFEYRKRVGGVYMPAVFATIKMQGWVSPFQEFFVDSGCGLALAPSSCMAGWGRLPDEVDTGLLDAHGQTVRGSPLDVDIQIDPLPPIRLRVFFSNRFRWGLLGQTWFERVGAHFENFPSADSRWFELFMPS